MCEPFTKVYKTLVKKYGLISAVLYGEIESRYNYFKAAGQLTEEGYCYVTVQMIEDGTGIGRKSQERYIKPLIKDGLLGYKVQGMPRKRYFKPLVQYGQNIPTDTDKISQQYGQNIPTDTDKNSLLYGQNIPNIGTKYPLNKNKEEEQSNKNKREEQKRRDREGARAGDDLPKKKATKKKFTPPTLEEVKAYAFERHSSVDPHHFWEYYDTGNWVDAKGNHVRNWKQKFLTWEKHNQPKAKPKEDSRMTLINKMLSKYSGGEYDGQL